MDKSYRQPNWDFFPRFAFDEGVGLDRSNNFRTLNTDPAVVTSEKEKPTTIILATFASSAAEPIESANGRVTSDGTKKTGSHLASSMAPGCRI